MNYVPGFVEWLFIGGVTGCSAGILKLLCCVDRELQGCGGKRLWTNWFCYSSIVSVSLLFVVRHSTGLEQIGLLLLGNYLVVCTVTDTLIYQVYDVMQYWGVLGGGIWLIGQRPEKSIGFSLILFAVIQYFVLIHMYGKADGMGYCVCSLYLAGMGIDIEGYLYHMSISFCLLAMVQGAKGNISGKGNLKTVVALYPYITTSYLFMWIFLF